MKFFSRHETEPGADWATLMIRAFQQFQVMFTGMWSITYYMMNSTERIREMVEHFNRLNLSPHIAQLSLGTRSTNVFYDHESRKFTVDRECLSSSIGSLTSYVAWDSAAFYAVRTSDGHRTKLETTESDIDSHEQLVVPADLEVESGDDLRLEVEIDSNSNSSKVVFKHALRASGHADLRDKVPESTTSLRVVGSMDGQSVDIHTTGHFQSSWLATVLDSGLSVRYCMAYQSGGDGTMIVVS